MWVAGQVVSLLAKYTVLVVIDPGTQNETQGGSAEIELGRVELTVADSPGSPRILLEESHPPPNEEVPGTIVVVNSDDDDENQILDKDEPDTRSVPGEDDLLPVSLHVDAKALRLGQVLLEITSGRDKIKVWADQSRGQLVGLPRLWDLTKGETVPPLVYVEGTKSSQAVGDVGLRLNGWETFSRTQPFSDSVKVSVIEVDVDLDSDNNQMLMPPARSNDEDRIEDVTNDLQHPGKLVIANINDDDRDRIPDFADGYNRDAAEADDDINADEAFVPMVIQLSDVIDPATAQVRITYSDSDPVAVTKTGTIPEFIYNPAPGDLRLWKVNGNAGRNSASVSDATPGDYIPSDTFTAAQLGFAETARTLTFYLEGITASAGISDQQILVEIDPDGNGPLGFIASDTVRVTVVELNLVDDNSGSTVIGGSIAWITEEPEMPHLQARLNPELGLTTVSLSEWTMRVEHQRPDLGTVDQVFVPNNDPAAVVSLPVSDTWDIHADIDGLPDSGRSIPAIGLLQTESLSFFGGKATVRVELASLLETEMQFEIRGRNPEDRVAREFIDMEADPNDEWFAYAIARHESRQGDNIYNQFHSRENEQKGTPIFSGNLEGWGMFQLDFSGDDARAATFSEIWNWQENVRSGIEILRAKRAIATNWMQSLAPSAAGTRPIGQRPQSQLDNPLNPPGVIYDPVTHAVVGGAEVPEGILNLVEIGE